MDSLSKYGGKRLSEHLEDQQEPFLLHDYLIENGYSSRARKYQNAATCSCSLSACKKFLSLSGHGFKRRSRGGGNNLRFLLNKILYQRVIKKVLNWGGASKQCSEVMEFRRLSKSSCGDYERDLDDTENLFKILMDESRQLSPCSVFELHSDEDSSMHENHDNHYEDENPSSSGNGSPKDEIFHSISPLNNAMRNMELKDLCDKEVNRERIGESQMKAKQIEEQVFLSWEKIAGDIAKVPEFVELDFSETRREWTQFKAGLREVGREIEILIFEEMRRETVLDLLSSHCTL